MSIRVLVYDEQAVIRVGLRAMLQPEQDIDVVGEAENLGQALSAVERLKPDVVLIGTGLAPLDGVEATRRLAGPDVELPTPVIIVSAPERNGGILEAVRAGASGFVCKDSPTSEFVQAVRAVSTGSAWLTPSAARRLLDWAASTRPDSADKSPAALALLTRREREVLKLMARGDSDAQVAEALSVSEATVRSHIHHVVSKLGIEGRVQAIALAYKHGLVTPSDWR